jgi:hypothetical protein
MLYSSINYYWRDCLDFVSIASIRLTGTLSYIYRGKVSIPLSALNTAKSVAASLSFYVLGYYGRYMSSFAYSAAFIAGLLFFKRSNASLFLAAY